MDTHSQSACKMSSFLEGNSYDHAQISVAEYSFVMSSSFSTFLRSVPVTIYLYTSHPLRLFYVS